MRARATVLLAPAVVVALLLGGCSGKQTAAPSGSPVRAATPRLGGPSGGRTTPPVHTMNRLERPVAGRLARQVAHQGLTLSYLDCPRWDGAVPVRITCRSFVDGIAAQVRVHLRTAVAGRLGFDARLADGVIATRTLEATLQRLGWPAADCGAAPAYAARVGSRIVCRVTGSTQRSYVVATVVSRAGGVEISGYRHSRG